MVERKDSKKASKLAEELVHMKVVQLVSMKVQLKAEK